MALKSCLFKVSLQALPVGVLLLDKSLVPVYRIATAPGMHAPRQVSKVLSKASSCGDMSKLSACAAPACQTGRLAHATPSTTTHWAAAAAAAAQAPGLSASSAARATSQIWGRVFQQRQLADPPLQAETEAAWQAPLGTGAL